MRLAEIGKLSVCVVLCEGAGAVGSFFTAPAIPTWYVHLKKPAFTPPDWIFAPVWTALYAAMGVALYMVWRKGFDRPDVRQAMAVFGAQLFLNVLWSFLFFGLTLTWAGVADIILLWIAILTTLRLFWRIDRWAGALLVPYLAWVSYAAVLNIALWRLNY